MSKLNLPIEEDVKNYLDKDKIKVKLGKNQTVKNFVVKKILKNTKENKSSAYERSGLYYLFKSDNEKSKYLDDLMEILICNKIDEYKINLVSESMNQKELFIDIKNLTT